MWSEINKRKFKVFKVRFIFISWFIFSVHSISSGIRDVLDVVFIFLFGIKIFFERCDRCGHLIWLKKDVSILNRMFSLGPLSVPEECSKCGEKI
jgi:hypothetical protein